MYIHLAITLTKSIVIKSIVTRLIQQLKLNLISAKCLGVVIDRHQSLCTTFPVCSNPIEQLNSNPIEQLNSNPIELLNSNPIEQLNSNPIEQLNSNPIEHP